MTRALGLDVGSRTIGIAITDELRIAAHPLETLERAGTAADCEAIAALIAERGVVEVVVGLPLELSGVRGRRAERVGRFARALARRLGDQVPIHEWDERFSTAATERVLIEADLSRRRRRQVIDKQAAAYILQGWLEHQARMAGAEPDVED